ncbi:hypothetical protein [Fictibacillus sp. NRS-1165]|uniref:hypothetical protein n=1 Tax=Fictibacillus sp. NRS-1165 TaxID=3144463 RepID=UPI003D238B28
MELSKQSQEFLQNLRLYLFSSGRKKSEIEEITEELGDHLREAERNGKSITHIIGQSPEQYMESIAKEMKVDYFGWSKVIPVLISGAFACLCSEMPLKTRCITPCML